MNWNPKFLCSILEGEVTNSAVCRNIVKENLWVSNLRKQLQIFTVSSLCSSMINNDYESFNILLIKINPYLSPITHPMNHNSKEWNIIFIFWICSIYFHPIDFFFKKRVTGKRAKRKRSNCVSKTKWKNMTIFWIF